jgi:hypothetical protein
MTASRTTRRSARRTTRARKAVSRRPAARSRKAAAKPAPKAAGKLLAKVNSRLNPAPQVLFRLCRPGWTVIVEKIPNAQGTRFVCPFCPLSHRVPGPVRGFRKLRRAQWVKQRRVEE